MAEVNGTVSMSVTKERVPKAMVEARSGAQIKHKEADNQGAFTFDGLEGGSWTFVALGGEKTVPGRSKTLKVPEETDKGGVWLSVVRKESCEDRKAGRLFFGGLLVAFALLILVYIGLHLWMMEGAEPLSETMLVAMDSLDQQARAATKDKDKAAGAALLAAMADIGSDVETVLSKREDMTELDKLVFTGRVNTIKESLAEDTAEATLTTEAESRKLLRRLSELREMIKAPKAEFGIWKRDPLRILEVLLWALAGILVRKIIIIGWYLRRRSFQKEGIVMHIAHLVATPLMVLVVVFLLSLVSLNITLATGNSLTLDLSDPRVMVAFSFLLGTIPWPLWNFITNTAEKFPSGIGA